MHSILRSSCHCDCWCWAQRGKWKKLVAKNLRRWKLLFKIYWMKDELITDQLIYYLTAKMKGMSRTIVFLVREKERVRKRGKRWERLKFARKLRWRLSEKWNNMHNPRSTLLHLIFTIHFYIFFFLILSCWIKSKMTLLLLRGSYSLLFLFKRLTCWATQKFWKVSMFEKNVTFLRYLEKSQTSPATSFQVYFH